MAAGVPSERLLLERRAPRGRMLRSLIIASSRASECKHRRADHLESAVPTSHPPALSPSRGPPALPPSAFLCFHLSDRSAHAHSQDLDSTGRKRTATQAVQAHNRALTYTRAQVTTPEIASGTTSRRWRLSCPTRSPASRRSSSSTPVGRACTRALSTRILPVHVRGRAPSHCVCVRARVSVHVHV